MEKRFARMTPEGVRMMPVPCNGWLDGRACSNLHRVFDRDTEAARRCGWMELVSEPVEFRPGYYYRPQYRVEQGRIVESFTEHEIVYDPQNPV